MCIAIANHKQHTPCDLLLSGNNFDLANKSLSGQLYKNKNITETKYHEAGDLNFITLKCI